MGAGAASKVCLREKEWKHMCVFGDQDTSLDSYLSVGIIEEIPCYRAQRTELRFYRVLNWALMILIALMALKSIEEY